MEEATKDPDVDMEKFMPEDNFLNIWWVFSECEMVLWNVFSLDHHSISATHRVFFPPQTRVTCSQDSVHERLHVFMNIYFFYFFPQ